MDYLGRLRDSLTLRAAALGVLTLLMLIPVGMIGDVIDERHMRYRSVVEQIGQEWAGPQTVTGPVLLLPFTERWTTNETVVDEGSGTRHVQREHTRNGLLAVLPQTLTIRATLDVEARHRGIYEAMVYATDVTLAGRFAPPDWTALTRNALEVDWDHAVLAVGVCAPIGIRSAKLVLRGAQAGDPQPGTPSALLPAGMHWRLQDARAFIDQGAFDLTLALRGSEQIDFTPLGATTDIELAAAWPHPSFIGVLPAERGVRADGFDAQWVVSNLSRSYPQAFDHERSPDTLQEVRAGVRLVQPVFLYSLTDRAVKYAVLFIALTFLALLLFELVGRTPVHYVQYGVIGAALALFYLLLLALSEHIGFGAAYMIAAATLVLMVTAYAAAVLGGWKRALWIGLLETATFTVLYVVLRLEDYALLTGTGALLVALAALMYFTRSLSNPEPAAPAR